MTINKPVRIEVFIDYTCPWVRQTGIWLTRVKSRLGTDLDVAWRCFALEQVNAREAPGWKAWQQGPEYLSRGLMALRGGVAARRQGYQAHERYMMAIFEAKHEERRDVRTREAVLTIAREAGLDMKRFEADLDDPSTIAEVAADHERAAAEGIFGTPTVRFEDGSAAYLKMYTPPEEDTLDAFEHLIGMAQGRRYFGELKRPQPPWPRGALDQ